MAIAETDSLVGRSARVRPVVVVSQCLGFEAVRYNGQLLQDRFVRALEEYVDFVQVCPEVGIGLGVPRDPIRLVSLGDQRRLVQPATGADVTDRMREYSSAWLAGLGAVDGFILKSRSPSCGTKDVKVYPAEAGVPATEKAPGLFAEAVLERFPSTVVEEDGRLTNFRIRHFFLVRLFASARLREVERSGAMAELVRFHTEYKMQLMAYSQAGLRELGRIVANPDRLPFAEVLERYRAALARVTARPARNASMVNALMHAFGYLSDGLGPAERTYFLAILEEYRNDRFPLSAVLAVLWSWVLRFDQGYLAGQRVFEPYPRALFELTDSGNGRA